MSDLILKKPLPPEIAKDVMAYVGCIAGAITAEDYRSGLLDAGFAEVQVTDTGADLNAYTKVEGQGSCCSAPSLLSIEPAKSGGCCNPPQQAADNSNAVHGGLRQLLARYDVNEYAASARVFAVKSN